MTITEELSRFTTLFIDTAPFIYHIEAHPLFGPITKEVFDLVSSGRITAYSSVLTLTEVLPKPVELKNEKLAQRFSDFLEHGQNLSLIEVTLRIASSAGKLCGRYPRLRALDAVQIAAALDVSADAFLTNDKRLKGIREVRIVLLSDYLSTD